MYKVSNFKVQALPAEVGEDSVSKGSRRRALPRAIAPQRELGGRKGRGSVTYPHVTGDEKTDQWFLPLRHAGAQISRLWGTWNRG